MRPGWTHIPPGRGREKQAWHFLEEWDGSGHEAGVYEAFLEMPKRNYRERRDAYFKRTMNYRNKVVGYVAYVNRLIGGPRKTLPTLEEAMIWAEETVYARHVKLLDELEQLGCRPLSRAEANERLIDI